MAYRLEWEASAGEELRRVAREQIERGIEELGGESPIGEKAHQVRKRCKKIRGLLRLYRPVIGKTYKKENRAFRDLGRRLAPTRDADSLLETYDWLLHAYADEIDRSRLGPLRRRLTEHRRHIHEELSAKENLVESTRSGFQAALVRLAEWTPSNEGFAAVRGGLKKSYKRGRARLDELAGASEPEPELTHEWRKRVKYHWYHVRLLEALWPELIGRRAEEVHRLSNYLGAANDLAELQEALRGEIGDQASDERVAVVIGLAEQERRRLIDEALPLGRLVFSQKPKDLVRQASGWWRPARG
ncbi:MAG: CHAD domain-containing protein [Spirochaetales bacterium]